MVQDFSALPVRNSLITHLLPEVDEPPSSVFAKINAIFCFSARRRQPVTVSPPLQTVL